MKKDIFDCGFESREGMKPSLFRLDSGEMGVSLYDDGMNRTHFYSIQKANEMGECDGERLCEEMIIPNKQRGIQSVVYATNTGIEVNSVITRCSVCFVSTFRS